MGDTEDEVVLPSWSRMEVRDNVTSTKMKGGEKVW